MAGVSHLSRRLPFLTSTASPSWSCPSHPDWCWVLNSKCVGFGPPFTTFASTMRVISGRSHNFLLIIATPKQVGWCISFRYWIDEPSTSSGLDSGASLWAQSSVLPAMMCESFGLGGRLHNMTCHVPSESVRTDGSWPPVETGMTSRSTTMRCAVATNRCERS